MPFNRPTPKDIQQRLQAEADTLLEGSDARLRYSPEAVLVKVAAMASHEHFSYLEWLSKQILVSTADAEFLLRHADEWGLFQKPATKATGKTRFFGTNGIVIPAGTLLRRNDDALFMLDADVTIAGGFGLGNLSAADWGAAGNTAPASKLSLTSPILGVQSDTVVENDGSGFGLSGGTDIEDLERLRERVLERKQNPPQGGSAPDYIFWAKEVPGVTRAWSYPNQLGRGTVAVIIVMDDKAGTIIPSAGEVAAVKAHIEVKRPATAEVTVIAPTPVPVNFTININPSSLVVRAAIEAELKALFKRESKPGGTLYLSRIKEAISLAAGEHHHVLVAPDANVVRTFGNLSFVGNFTWGDAA